MKNKFLIISLAMSGITVGQQFINGIEIGNNDGDTCDGITRNKGTRCKIKVDKEITNFCYWHHPDSINVNRCTGHSKTQKRRCLLKTKHESGRCHQHRYTK